MPRAPRALLFALHVAALAVALENGLARTPPCGLNSYMAGGSGAAFLNAQADYFISSGLRELCFVYVNTDEGWEEHDRDPVTRRLVADPNQYPDGIANFTAALAARGMKFGLYGAASGVTCGGVSGQLGYEDLDVETFMSWGVSYLKSDLCSSYAMDSSVRVSATRDALLRANASIVLSIEPFSITPDTRQSSKIANLWRVGKDICGDYACTLDRASVSDKWAPIAGPGGFNDPDMMNVGAHSTDGENRVLFGLWSIMKAPLLLSANLPKLPLSIQKVIMSPEVIAVNQDVMGVQARKLMLNGTIMPWLVGLESCAAGVGGGAAGMRNRGWSNSPPADTRVWRVEAHASVAGAVAFVNAATGRCLVPGASQVPAGAAGAQSVVLLPCDLQDAQQAWSRGTGGAQTVSALVHNTSGLALIVGNSTIFGAQHKYDSGPVADAAYGTTVLTLGPFSPTQPCTTRDCEGYAPEQLWYGPDVVDGFIAQATYVASINHCDAGDCYELTPRTPTYQHHCLAHVLSVGNAPSDSGETEVWGGPLDGGAFVLGLLFAGSSSANATIAAPFSALGVAGIGDESTFCVRSLWAPAADVGTFTGSFSAVVQSHDLGVFKLTPGPCKSA